MAEKPETKGGPVQRPGAAQAAASSGDRDTAPSRTLRSEEILAGHREVRILHQGEVYRLRVTRRGKLILQK